MPPFTPFLRVRLALIRRDHHGDDDGKLDRHQHIGKGTIGLDVFRRLLSDPRLSHAAFIAETPIDQPGDDRRNVTALKKLVLYSINGVSTPTQWAALEALAIPQSVIDARRREYRERR